MIQPEKVGMSSERLARIRPAIEKHIGKGKIAGAVTLLARRGELVHLDCLGLQDREKNVPMQPDTIFRIYSMTKPITCVALMMLYEKGYFQLSEPVAKFIPAFQNLKVYAGDETSGMRLVDLKRPVTLRDLLTHTAGLTYAFLEYGPVEALYRQDHAILAKSLAEFVADVVKRPLAFQPGTAWRYSVAHDFLAYLVERMSGQPFDVYLRANVFEPLGMTDTGFYVPAAKLDRLAALYGSAHIEEPDMTGSKAWMAAANGVHRLLAGPADSRESTPHRVIRGGHGLVSTAPDYFRFCQMLLNKGELDGIRLLGRKTIELMTVNHLAPELMPYEIGWSYSPGYGYGLGFRVLQDVGQCGTLGSPGEYGWGGAATTYFWIDPQEELIGIVMAQFMPSGYHLIDSDFRVLAYQAIAD